MKDLPALFRRFDYASAVYYVSNWFLQKTTAPLQEASVITANNGDAQRQQTQLTI